MRLLALQHEIRSCHAGAGYAWMRATVTGLMERKYRGFQRVAKLSGMS